MDTTTAKALAVATTGYAEPHGCNRHSLEFRDLTTNVPLDGLRQVKGAYDGCSRCHLCQSAWG